MACYKCCIFINSYCDYGGSGDDVDNEKLVFMETN